MKNGILIVCLSLIGWDVFTTYYGTLSIFTPDASHYTFWERIVSAPIFIQILSVLFSLSLIMMIIGYKAILRADNKVTKPLLFVAFIYDFGTSIYGTSQAADLSNQNSGGWAIVLLFSCLVMAFINR